MYTLTEMALDRMTWRSIHCPWCWSQSSAVWVGGRRTTGCSGPGSPWTCAWRFAVNRWPPSARRTPDRKRSPTSPGTVVRTVPARTQPGLPSSTGSGTGSPVDGKGMCLVRWLTSTDHDKYKRRRKVLARTIIFKTTKYLPSPASSGGFKF